jgi:hypothetical protein
MKRLIKSWTEEKKERLKKFAADAGAVSLKRKARHHAGVNFTTTEEFAPTLWTVGISLRGWRP